jgi:hypothetical protein
MPVVLVLAVLVVADPDPVTLAEVHRPGDTTVVTLHLRQTGAVLIEGGRELPVRSTGKLVFEERTLDIAPTGFPTRSVRRYEAAAADVDVDKRLSRLALRDAVRIVVAELRGDRPFTFSPSGPLTAEELDLIQTASPCNTMTLHGLLPARAAAPGETWKPSDTFAETFFCFDMLAVNGLTARIESLTTDIARLSISGKVEGIVLGAKSEIDVSGSATFDRKASKLVRIELKLRERKEAGLVDPGTRIEGELSFERKVAAGNRLADPAIAKLPTTANPATELLLYAHPQGDFRFYYPRGWYIAYSDARTAVLKFIEGGNFLVQCNVTTASPVAPGTHVQPDEFRSQVRMALGPQFERIVQEGDLPASRGNWIYRLVVEGKSEKELAAWNYYVAAGPQGQQVVFAFTMAARHAERLAAQDLSMVGSIDFPPPRTASKP